MKASQNQLFGRIQNEYDSFGDNSAKNLCCFVLSVTLFMLSDTVFSKSFLTIGVIKGPSFPKARLKTRVFSKLEIKTCARKTNEHKISQNSYESLSSILANYLFFNFVCFVARLIAY